MCDEHRLQALRSHFNLCTVACNLFHKVLVDQIQIILSCVKAQHWHLCAPVSYFLLMFLW